MLIAWLHYLDDVVLPPPGEEEDLSITVWCRNLEFSLQGLAFEHGYRGLPLRPPSMPYCLHAAPSDD